MDPEQKVSLSSLARGAAIERFDDELRLVLDNILDPNTALGVRSVTLKVEFKPSEDRRAAGVRVFCTSKIQSATPVPTTVYLGKVQGQSVALEHHPEQMDIEFGKKTPVVGIGPGGERKGE